MSAVGSSDSSNNNSSRAADESVRKNREQYQASEGEMAKKQAKEIRRLNEEHYAEVENLKKAHQSQMEDLRKATSNEINDRDHQYNKDVEQLRELYKQQMTAQAETSQQHQDALRKATGGDLDQSKAQAEARLQKLTSDYDNGLRDREHIYEGALKQNREAQKNAIEDNREKLQHSFDISTKSLKEERNMRVNGLQKGYDDYRQSAEAQKRDSDLRHFQDQERSSNNLLRAVNKERLNKIDSDENLRDGFKDGLEKTRERFEKAASKEREANSLTRDQMKSSVGDRIENQMRRLETENYDLKEGSIRNDMKTKQKAQREVANIADAYQKNMDVMQEERDEAIHQTNDRVHKDVTKIRKDLDHQATETNRYYRAQQNQNDTIHREAYDSLKMNLENRNEAQKQNADLRVKNLYETTNDEKTRMAEQQVETHQASQYAHQDEMNLLRHNLENDKAIAVGTLQDHIQKQETAHADRMAQVVGKYEKQIQTLKDEMMKEKKQNDESLKRVTEEMQRQHKLSMDQVAQQNSARLRQLDAQHNEELRGMNKRNDERIDQVLSSVKKT